MKIEEIQKKEIERLALYLSQNFPDIKVYWIPQFTITWSEN